jgi:hypothetical protein
MKNFLQFLSESDISSGPLRAGTIEGYSSGPLRAGTIEGYSSGPLRAGTIEVPKPVTTTPKPTVKPSVPATKNLSKFKLPTFDQVSDLLDISSPAAVATGAVVDLAKANWDAIKTTPVWAAEKMGQKVETPDAALIRQLQDGEEEIKNTPSRYRK